MFLKIIYLSTLVFSLSLHSQTIEVSSYKSNFKLLINKNHDIKLIGRQARLSIDKNKCNESIVNDFINNTNLIFTKNFKNITPDKNKIKLTLNGKSYYQRVSSAIGKKLMLIPREIQRIKIQNKILCSNIEK